MTEDVATELKTRTGLTLVVRQAGPADAPILVELVWTCNGFAPVT